MNRAFAKWSTKIERTVRIRTLPVLFIPRLFARARGGNDKNSSRGNVFSMDFGRQKEREGEREFSPIARRGFHCADAGNGRIYNL